MTPVVPLWGVAAALYAWECFVALPRDGFALAARGRAFVARPGDSLPGTRARGYLLANPLPPFGLVFVLGGGNPRGPAETSFQGVRQRLDVVRREALPLKIAGTASFVAIFVVLPAAEALGALSAVAPWLFGSILLLHVAAIALARRARARLGTAAGWKEVLALAASPLSSLRAGGTVGAHAWDDFEPLAVAFVLLEPADFLELARRRVDLGLGDPGRRVLSAAGVRPEELGDRPLSEDAAARSWCPRCRTFFAIEAGTCADCSSPLRPLDPQERAAARGLLARVERARLRGAAR